jgi:hypothetical protein
MAGAGDEAQVLVMVGFIGGFAQGQNNRLVEG